jgi:hypothetical protein
MNRQINIRRVAVKSHRPLATHALTEERIFSRWLLLAATRFIENKGYSRREGIYGIGAQVAGEVQVMRENAQQFRFIDRAYPRPQSK